MNAQEVNSTISFYQKKYPDSAIIIYSGQRETFDKEKLPILSQEEINASRYYNLDGVVQIFHSQDFNDNYDKKQDRIFLFTEKQDGIVKCDFCNNMCGENMICGINKDDSYNTFCNDCYSDREEHYCSRCKDSGCISCRPSTFL